jgi:hypothetical protein
LPVVVEGIECPTCRDVVYEDGARWFWRCPQCFRDGTVDDLPASVPAEAEVTKRR